MARSELRVYRGTLADGRERDLARQRGKREKQLGLGATGPRGRRNPGSFQPCSVRLVVSLLSAPRADPGRLEAMTERSRPRPIPLPLELASTELVDALRPMIEGIAVKVAGSAVRRMLVDAAHAVAKNREDLEQLLAQVGRVMDEVERQ